MNLAQWTTTTLIRVSKSFHLLICETKHEAADLLTQPGHALAFLKTTEWLLELSRSCARGVAASHEG